MSLRDFIYQITNYIMLVRFYVTCFNFMARHNLFNSLGIFCLELRVPSDLKDFRRVDSCPLHGYGLFFQKGLAKFFPIDFPFFGEFS